MERVALFLKGVNVGGKNRLRMPALKELLSSTGCEEPRTYLQSGNAVVTTALPARRLEDSLAKAIRDEFDLSTEVFSVPAGELREVVSANPFPELAAKPKSLHVAFLHDSPPKDWFEEAGLVHAKDRIGFGSHNLYLAYTTNSRDSPLAAVLRNSKLSFTARNWATVLAMTDLLS